MSKFLTFIKNFAPGKTLIFRVTNSKSGEVIGTIKWATNFRKYAFWPHDETYYDAGCLKDIADFITKLMDERKKQRQAKLFTSFN